MKTMGNSTVRHTMAWCERDLYANKVEVSEDSGVVASGAGRDIAICDVISANKMLNIRQMSNDVKKPEPKTSTAVPNLLSPKMLLVYRRVEPVAIYILYRQSQ